MLVFKLVMSSALDFDAQRHIDGNFKVCLRKRLKYLFFIDLSAEFPVPASFREKREKDGAPGAVELASLPHC
jgi:hypothetical protein